MVLDEVFRACPGLFFLLGDMTLTFSVLLPDTDTTLAGVRAGVFGLVTIGARKNSSSDVM
jgi:hypothetical protein